MSLITGLIIMKKFMIYGANGYTGRLITETAVEKGMNPVVAGRNREAVEMLANKFNLDSSIFNLNETGRIDNALKNIDVLLHVAGPYSKTLVPMLEACLRTKTHYLDLSGEIDDFDKV